MDRLFLFVLLFLARLSTASSAPWARGTLRPLAPRLSPLAYILRRESAPKRCKTLQAVAPVGTRSYPGTPTRPPEASSFVQFCPVSRPSHTPPRPSASILNTRTHG
jgi:hypothetical protein